MVVSKDELIECVKNLVGDNTSDDVITLLENLSDTLTNSGEDNENWKKKYDELDANWRRKYIERFSSGNPADVKEKDEAEKVTYSDLFA